jgi:hypothetical protein
MQQVKQPKPPPELGPEGKKLFRQIVADAAGQGIELTAAELVYLRQAGKLADSIALMEEALAGAELIVPGYMNKGLQANPLISELRMRRQLLGQTVARIDPNVPEPAGITGGAGGNRFRQAALARWNRAGA